MANEYQGSRVPSYRNLNPLYRALFRSDKLHPVILVTAEFETETLRLWSGYDTLTYDSNAYVGAGTLLSVSALSESSDIRANGITVGLSGISTTIISLALAENLNKRNIAVDLAFIAGDSDEIVNYQTRVTQSGSPSKFVIENSVAGTIVVKAGDTYRFYQDDLTNTNHDFRVSTTSNGTHGGGSQYTTGWSSVGTAGSAGAYQQWVVPAAANSTMYYYDSAVSGAGGTISVISDYILPTPQTVFKGLMDKMDISDNGDTCTVALKCENFLARLLEVKVRRYTTEDQKVDYPNDKGLDFVVAIQDQEIAWGSVT
tara:strand:- start:3197 stop:4138 length:942 start_codon:yes stop_codon:yes gene_type:complete